MENDFLEALNKAKVLFEKVLIAEAKSQGYDLSLDALRSHSRRMQEEIERHPDKISEIRENGFKEFMNILTTKEG